MIRNQTKAAAEAAAAAGGSGVGDKGPRKFSKNKSFGSTSKRFTSSLNDLSRIKKESRNSFRRQLSSPDIHA